jgi:hypothetical protein
VKKSSKGLMITVIVLVSLVILGSIGAGVWYLLPKPQPVISVDSDFKAESSLVGATDTTFKIIGQKFSSNSLVTFLLDGKPVPGNQPVQSDSNGNVSANIKVTNDWSVGNHTLSAKDASNYETKLTVPVKIVQAGESKTPGPNGAPSNDAKGTVAAVVTVDGKQTPDKLSLNTMTYGAVCRERDDNQSHAYQSDVGNGVTVVVTITASCSEGSYSSGKVIYVETVTSAKAQYSNGVTCTFRTPFVNQRWEGTFTSATNVSGTYTTQAVTFDCDHGQGSQTASSTSGTWTGIFSKA